MHHTWLNECSHPTGPGVSRMIDVIEASGAQIFVPTGIGVTGCSRSGKGAFIAGAFDERVALTIGHERDHRYAGSGSARGHRARDKRRLGDAHAPVVRDVHPSISSASGASSCHD